MTNLINGLLCVLLHSGPLVIFVLVPQIRPIS